MVLRPTQILCFSTLSAVSNVLATYLSRQFYACRSNELLRINCYLLKTNHEEAAKNGTVYSKKHLKCTALFSLSIISTTFCLFNVAYYKS